VALLTPVRTPGVLAEPIFEAILNTPSNTDDSVTTSNTTSLVNINTALVAHEILIDSKGNRERTVCKDFSSHFITVVVFPCLDWIADNFRSVGALCWACGDTTRARNIWHTFVSADTLVAGPVPCAIHVATVAGIVC